jgi:methionyl-tRNA synthetase
MSKSLGNFIPPAQLVEQYGVDAVRYFMLRELPFGSDGDFSHRAVIARINGDLANGLGNLAQRVLTLIARNCEGVVPDPGTLTASDEALLASARSLLSRVRPDFNQQAFHRALETIWQVVAEGDRYVAEQAPWALAKTDVPRMKTVLYVGAETIRHLAILVQPVVPGAAARLLDLLGAAADARDFAALTTHKLVPGTALPKPVGVFPKHVEKDEGKG